MAATFAAAFAEVTAAMDRTFYARPRFRRRPANAGFEAALAEIDYPSLLKQARRAAQARGRDPIEGEEALQEEVTLTMEKRPSELRRPGWEKRLITRASFRLRGEVTPRRALFFSGFESGDGEAALAAAELCVPVTNRSEEDARYAALPMPGEAWNRTQIIAALQRFRDYYGRPPRVSECRAANRLPCYATIRRHFRNFDEAILAAGMVPMELGRRRKQWPAVEAARVCRSHKRRHGDWPNSTDLQRYPGVLPSRSAMIRCFGSTRPSEVGKVAEAILAHHESSS